MTWLIILVVLAAAFAPVAYMMPSKRDRALADLRMVARREGLEVDVTRLPNLHAEAHERVSASGRQREAVIDCVSYGLRLNKAIQPGNAWRLLHDTNTEFPVLDGTPWEYDRQFPSAGSDVPAAAYWHWLGGVTRELPADVLGLAVTDDFVLCYWQERLKDVANPATLVAQIRQTLNLIANHHQTFFHPEPPAEID